MRLLLVEDDIELSHRLKQSLSKAGYAVDISDNGIDAQHLGKEESYDLVVLDLGLPEKPGLEVLRAWREEGMAVPVLVLTARDAWHERVDGFQAGADDYLGKPFHQEELLERIKALLRRQIGRPAQDQRVAGFRLDEERQLLQSNNGSELALTGTEFRLLRYFMAHPGKLLSKTRLTEHVYAYDNDRDSNVIEVYVNRLRRKIGKEFIKTRRGQGYVFDEEGR